MGATSSDAGTTRGSAAVAGGLFRRQASGLVRELGVPAAVAISLSSVAVVVVFLTFDAGLTSFNKADMYLSMVIGGIVWIFAMFAYRYLITAMPRAGGEYVYVSRVISPVLGAMIGIFTAVVLTYTLSTNIHLAATFVPFMLTALGSAFHSSGIANAANDVTSNLDVLLISFGLMLVVGVASISFSLKRLAQIILAMCIFQFMAFAFLMVLLADHSHSDFVAAFARFSHHPGAYSALISLGSAKGVSYGVSLGAAIGLVPLLVLAYNGVLYSYYVGGELRRPTKTYIRASSIGLVLIALLWFVTWALMRHTVGLHFMQAQTNLAASDPTGYEKITSLNPGITGLGYGYVLAGDPISKILFGLAEPVALVAVALTFTALATRILFALAFDRMLPVGVAKLSERNRAPIVGVAIVTVLSLGFLGILAYAVLSNIFALLSLFLAIVLLSGGLSATFLAHRRPDLLLKPGETELPRWLGLPVSTWLGGVTTVLALFTIVEVVVHPAVYGKFGAESISTLAIVLLAGPAIYLVARTVARRRNQIDLDLAMRTLPPE